MIDKAAGRVFATAESVRLDTLNRCDPPDYPIPYPYLAIYRHPCPVRVGRSSALAMHEVYRVDPDGSGVAFIYKEGRCRGCGALARSVEGRVVDAAARPPLSGRVTRVVR